MSPDRKLLLCIDDEPSALALRKMLLESAGYEVLAGEGGTCGLKLFDSHDVDAVVLDFDMPGMRGDAVARRMHQLKPRVPILLFTGCCELRDEELSCADAFLTKGGPPRDLFDAVDRLTQSVHRHSEWEGDYIAFADRERRYVEVTEPLASLLGYSREELLQMRIDDVTRVPENVPELWSSYLEHGYQEGTIELRHRDGHTLPVQYRAKVFPDGCMLSRLQPVSPLEAGQRAA